jgi:hypothetical protein
MAALKQLLLALTCVAWIVPGVHVLHTGMDDLDPAFSRFWSGKDPSAAAKASTGFTRGVFLMGTSRLLFDVFVVVNGTERPSRIRGQIRRKVPSGSEVIPK